MPILFRGLGPAASGEIKTEDWGFFGQHSHESPTRRVKVHSAGLVEGATQ